MASRNKARAKSLGRTVTGHPAITVYAHVSHLVVATIPLLPALHALCEAYPQGP